MLEDTKKIFVMSLGNLSILNSLNFFPIILDPIHIKTYEQSVSRYDDNDTNLGGGIHLS